MYGGKELSDSIGNGRKAVHGCSCILCRKNHNGKALSLPFGSAERIKGNRMFVPHAEARRGSMEILHPATLCRCLWRYRGLVGLLTVRELRTRYRGSVLGIAWTLLTPMLMLGVYAFAFGLVFPAKWPVVSETVPVPLTLFCGMAFFGLFADCFQRAPGLIVLQPQFVRK